MTKSKRTVLAVASGGGHWEQLMLLRSTLEEYDVRFATTDPAVARQRGIEAVDVLPDCNKDRPVRSILCGLAALRVVARHRPDIVVSTGAAPGLMCIIAGRLMGARTAWIDSVANGEQLSMCGKLSRWLAHECLSQWEHLARDPRVSYHGSVL
ncbi:MAG: glucuronosyltransferase [Erythrobacter sp.]|uniref:glucuronosyltransferase n=1 Tax=Erythrobacter sp. TaxID=1042 RepID=UPI003C771EFD